MPKTDSSAALPAPSLLIAVTGGPGSRKTHLLEQFALEQLARGLRVEGVLALAGTRETPQQGANEYRLRLLGAVGDLPWAVRDERLHPPYRFDPDTEKKLQAWAEELRQQPPAPVLILDEFGKFELRGQGLMPLWPALSAAAPHIVVIAMREELIPAFEEVLGRRFDVRLAASDPATGARLAQACADWGEWTRIGLYGGAAGGLELTVGSALHAAKIPLRGLAMSSLQAAMMVFAGAGLAEPGRVVWVPFISGGLKALSPAGNRVRPMIAIVMQGLLFGAAVQALGWNLLSLLLGGALVGSWAALQGFFLQYLMLGGDLLKAYDTLVAWLAEKWHITAPGLPWLIGGWTLLHAIVAAGVTLAAWRYRQPPAALQRLIAKESAPAAEAGPAAGPAWRRRMREFAHWQFWLPLVVVAAVLLGGGRPWESVAWLVLRFVAVAGVLLAVVSWLSPARWAEQLRRRGWWGPALAFSGALKRRDQAK